MSAADAIKAELRESLGAFLALATGLGKTLVGGEVIRRHLQQHPGTLVLFVLRDG